MNPLMNLLMNSLAATSENGGYVLLTLTSEGAREAVLKVIDDGKGISKEDLPNVFKPYFTSRADGYGIGLAIVKKIVDQSNWEIEIESKVGKGTTVTISGIKLV